MTYKIALLHTKLFRFMYHTPPICNLLLQLYLYIYRCTSLMFCLLTSEYSDVNGFGLTVLFNGLWYPLICTSSKVIISEHVTKLLIKKNRYLVKSLHLIKFRDCYHMDVSLRCFVCFLWLLHNISLFCIL